MFVKNHLLKVIYQDFSIKSCLLKVILLKNYQTKIVNLKLLI